MQAALQGGAAIWRPTITFGCARVTLVWVRSRAVVGVASDDTSNSAARRYLIFIVRFLDCGSRAPLEVRLSCVGINACPSLVERLELESEYSRTRKYWNSLDCCGDIRRACSREGEPPRRALVSSHERLLIRTVQSLRRLASSANASDLAVDVRIVLIEDILRD
jgi:hypothetical protein